MNAPKYRGRHVSSDHKKFRNRAEAMAPLPLNNRERTRINMSLSSMKKQVALSSCEHWRMRSSRLVVVFLDEPVQRLPLEAGLGLKIPVLILAPHKVTRARGSLKVLGSVRDAGVQLFHLIVIAVKATLSLPVKGRALQQPTRVVANK